MYIIKSKKGHIILFDDNEILIFNNSSIREEHRLFGIIFTFSIAIVGIIINLSGEKLYSLITFVILLLYGIINLNIYLFKYKKAPEQISYSDLNRIDFITSTKRFEVIFHYNNESKTFKFATEHIDFNVIEYLESKNQFIVNKK
jgi:hypothetical protein